MSQVQGILQGLYEANRVLTPEMVVEAARPAEHPLHGRFEWDDAVAGEAYRRVQAADLIRSVKITYATDPQGRDKKVRAFVSIRPEDAPHLSAYRPTEEVIADPMAYRLLLREMDRDWRRFRARYQHLQEFHALVAGEVEDTG